MRKFGKIAVLAGITAAVAIVPATSSQATGTHGKCSKEAIKYCPTVDNGRMTGHGHHISSTYGKVQWEFRNSICNADRFPDLKVEWGGNKFKLTSYYVPLRCIDTPWDEGQPKAGFDTIMGKGYGTLNGVPGAYTEFDFTDRGEPGRDDLANIVIKDADGDVVLSLFGVSASAGGNHQAHRVTGRAAR